VAGGACVRAGLSPFPSQNPEKRRSAARNSTGMEPSLAPGDLGAMLQAAGDFASYPGNASSLAPLGIWAELAARVWGAAVLGCSVLGGGGVLLVSGRENGSGRCGCGAWCAGTLAGYIPTGAGAYFGIRLIHCLILLLVGQYDRIC